MAWTLYALDEFPTKPCIDVIWKIKYIYTTELFCNLVHYPDIKVCNLITSQHAVPRSLECCSDFPDCIIVVIFAKLLLVVRCWMTAIT